MKQKTVGMLLLVALTLCLGSSVVSAQIPPAADDINYTGDIYLPCCNPCIEATVIIDGSPAPGVLITFTVDGGGSYEATTDENGVAQYCFEGCYPSGQYEIDATDPWGVTMGATTVYVYEARIAGGGQILAAPLGMDNPKKKDLYKISYGMGLYIVGGENMFDSCEVTFHNVTDSYGIDKWKFVGETLTAINYYDDNTVANFTVSGHLENKNGENQGAASVHIPLEDYGEPGHSQFETYYDNIRIKLSGVKTYDSTGSGDFPKESDHVGTSRTLITTGNLQVEKLDCPVPD
ncbi:hypothetical protein ACFL3Q_07705 [Planctomycetota bacterium]